MTNKQTLEKSINLAIDGGWKPVEKEFEWRVIDTRPAPFLSCMVAIVDTSAFDGDNVIEKKFTVNDVIFNHEFCKALWGVEPEYIGERYFENGGISDTLRLPKYLYHLQCMVIAKDPIAYLGDNI